MLIMFDDRTIDQPANSYAARLTAIPPDTDPNGTDAYNGNYKADAIFIGVGFTKTFAQ